MSQSENNAPATAANSDEKHGRAEPNPALANDPPAEPQLCLEVSGDVFETHQIHRRENSEGPTSRAHSAFTSSDFVYPTGAVLIEHLLGACKQHLQAGTDPNSPRNQYDIVGPESRGIVTPSTLLQFASGTDRHVTTSQPYKADSQKSRVRMWENLGLEPSTSKPVAPGSTEADFQIHDLSDLGQKDPFSITPGRVWTLLKLRNRSAREEFSSQNREAINEFLSDARNAAMTIILLNDIRQSHISISHEVSWERTLQQLVLCFEAAHEADHYLHFLSKAQHLVVSLAPDAVVYLGQSVTPQVLSMPEHPVIAAERELKRKMTDLCRLDQLDRVVMLVYEPASIEGDLGRQVVGHMRGMDSLLTVALAHHLVQSELSKRPSSSDSSPLVPAFPHLIDTISTALILGLKASRFLTLHGFDYAGREASSNGSLDPAINSLYETSYRVTGSYGGVSTEDPVFPYDLVGSIITTGNLDKYRAIPDDSSLRDEWKDCGWVYQHRVLPESIRTMIRSSADNWHSGEGREPHYRASFWTLRASSTGNAQLDGDHLNFTHDNGRSARVVVNIAKKILLLGPEWLTNSSSRKQRTEVLLDTLYGVGTPASPEPIDLDRIKDKCPSLHDWLLSDYTNDVLPVFPTLQLGGLAFLDRRQALQSRRRTANGAAIDGRFSFSPSIFSWCKIYKSYRGS
jgi:hypothetical protein